MTSSVPLSRTTPAAPELLGISCRTPWPGFDSNDRRHPRLDVGRAILKAASVTRPQISMAAAAGVVIHSSTSANVPSVYSTLSMAIPRNE